MLGPIVKISQILAEELIPLIPFSTINSPIVRRDQ